jgi:phosphonoacetaldehyde hydrolase
MNRFWNKSRYTFCQSTKGSLFFTAKQTTQGTSEFSLNSVILGLSGTIADPYSLAPTKALRHTFAVDDVPITWEEARIPDVRYHSENIKEVLYQSQVYRRWCDIKLSPPDQSTCIRLFDRYMKILPQYLQEYNQIIPGSQHTIQLLQNSYQMRVGIVSDLDSKYMDTMNDEIQKQGICADAYAGNQDDTPISTPFKLYKLLTQLDVCPIQSVVKVSSTVSGIQEGLQAGCWTVAVTRYCNYLGINTYNANDSLTDPDIQQKNTKAINKFVDIGAHYVIDTINDLPSVIDDINERLQDGDTP